MVNSDGCPAIIESLNSDSDQITSKAVFELLNLMVQLPVVMSSLC